ncbi:hypothetical protein QBK99_10035 [Corticibacterium sp. UT-5YL-CI-8]|nr:hypothetical protein [Tianweitania sp. UT-5YL-CI-8]
MLISTTAKWRALRALFEGSLADVGMLVAISGMTERGIAQRAKREGWQPPTVVEEALVKVRMLAQRCVKELEAIQAHPKTGFNKARIDALMSLVRAIEKVGDVLRSDDALKDIHAKRDADIGELLDKVDRRIVELAREYAERLVRERIGVQDAADRG